MKKTLFFATMVAVFALVSCAKEDALNEKSKTELVFTATIADSDTKTTINTDGSSDDKGKVYWVAGDEITITDAASKSAVYVAQSAGQTVNFTKKDGEQDLGDGPYTATYGTAPSTTQSYGDYYSAANVAKDLYMTAPSTSTKSLTFTAACGLLRLNLTAASGESTKDISKIEILVIPTSGTATIYTLNCSSAQGISTAKEFYLALPAGSYTVMKFTNSTGHICFKTAKTAVAMSNNAIQPTTISGIVFNDILPGKFSVSATTKVRFSKGNLQAEIDASGKPTKWKFAENQYDYIGEAVANTSIGKTAGTIDLFGWSADGVGAAAWGIKATSVNSDYSGNFKDWGNAISSLITWRTLSGGNSGEWDYLLSTRTVNGGTGEGNSYQRATVNSLYGLIIYPDNYTAQTSAKSYTSSQWQTMEAAGCVFLPAAGYRIESGVNSPNSTGDYWSSTASDSEHAYRFDFDGNSFGSISTSGRCLGQCVRLVQDI